MKRIYITREAYRALADYCLSRRGTLRGMARVASHLLLKAIQQELEVEAAAGIQQPAEGRAQAPLPPPEGWRRPSRLDDLEDCAFIRPRSPEALARVCAARGLLLYELPQLGGVLVATPRWRDFVLTAAEGDRTPPGRVEELAARAASSAAPSPDEKYLLTLLALNTAGELLWDGEKWVRHGGQREGG